MIPSNANGAALYGDRYESFCVAGKDSTKSTYSSVSLVDTISTQPVRFRAIFVEEKFLLSLLTKLTYSKLPRTGTYVACRLSM